MVAILQDLQKEQWMPLGIFTCIEQSELKMVL